MWAFLEDSAFQELGNVLAWVSWESPFSFADGSEQRRWRWLVSGAGWSRPPDSPLPVAAVLPSDAAPVCTWKPFL